MKAEEQFVASKRGKWSKRGVPHRGWVCVGIENLGEPKTVCQMCESQPIRYVHHMRHCEYPDILSVGCVCAGNMEGNIKAARKRESVMQSRAGKRKRWLTRKWRVSAKENPWIRTDGYRIIMRRRGAGWAWAYTISAEDYDLVLHSRTNYASLDRAKLAAFDHLTRLILNKQSQA
jgi:hypothetical protein